MRRLPGIIRTIEEANPDIIVITEFRRNDCEESLRDALRNIGLRHQICSEIPAKVNGIFVAAKIPLGIEDDPIAMHRLLPLYLPSLDLHLLGTHVPGMNDKWGKADIWDRVLDYALRHRDRRTLLIGDFNTGLAPDAEGAPFALPEKMERLIEMGYVDAWRSLHPDAREYTWWSTAGNGFRLDYAFLSPDCVPHLLTAFHNQDARTSGDSDHAPMTVALSVFRERGETSPGCNH